MFKRVPAVTSLRRSFSLTLGLREGYDDVSSKRHTVEEVIHHLQAWMVRRISARKPFLTGAVSKGEVVYAWPEGDGSIGKSHEPVVNFSGEVSALYDAHLSDKQVEKMLDSLAAHLGKHLGQTRVYVAYRDKTWILQAEGKKSSRGESI